MTTSMLAKLSRRLLSTRVLPSARQTVGDLAPTLHRLKPAEDRFLLKTDTPLGEAASHLVQQRLSFALVASAEESSPSVVGIIHDKSIIKYATQAADLAFFRGQQHDPPIERYMTPTDKMLSVRLDDTLERAMALMANGIYRHVPVLDHWSRLHSILDVRDVIMNVYGAEGASVWKGCTAADVLGSKRRQRLQKREAMAADGSDWKESLQTYLLHNAQRHTIRNSASVTQAARQMDSEGLTFLVVLDEEAAGSVVGLVNERSFVSFCAAVGGGEDANEAGSIGKLMTPLDQTINASLSSPATEIIDLFFEHNIRHLPIIDQGKLSGIISGRDLLRPLLS